MKTFSRLCTAAALILKFWFLGAWLAAGEISKYGVETKVVTPAVEIENDGSPSSAGEHTSVSPTVGDLRPEVVVDTYHDGLLSTDPQHKRLCEPCDKFHDWHATYHDVFPLQFQVRAFTNPSKRPAETWKFGTPIFRFKGADGKWYMHKGWDGPESLLRDYTKVNEGFGQAPMGMPSQAGGEDPLAIFKRLAGPGKFSWKPDKPVAGFVDDATFLMYSSVQGTVKLVNGQPVVQLSDPLPQVSVKKFGMWIRVNVYGVDGQLPDSVIVRHSFGRLKIHVEEAK